MHMNSDVQSYIDAIPEGKKLFGRLQALILSLYPDADAEISGQIPTYRLKHGAVGLGYWKRGVSLYLDPASDDTANAQEYRGDAPGISINFKIGDAIPEAALKRVIRNAVEHGDTKSNTKPTEKKNGRRTADHTHL
jgi:hypothetical protein